MLFFLQFRVMYEICVSDMKLKNISDVRLPFAPLVDLFVHVLN